MDTHQKAELLDTLEIELLRDGYSDLSLALEQFEDLHPDRRWQEISQCLRDEDLPSRYDAFLTEEIDWEAAAQALS